MKDTIKITQKDMNLISSLLPFTSPENIPLSYKLDGRAYRGLPADARVSFRRLDSNITLTEIEANLCPTITAKVECYTYCDFPCVEWVAYFTNNGSENSPILSDAKIIDAILPGEGEATLVHTNGDNCQPSGYEYYTDKLTAPIVKRPVDDGTSCNGAGPYMTLIFADHTVRIAIGWSGQWEAAFAQEKDGVSLICGQKRFNMYIKPGETMRTPRVTLLGYYGDETRGINIWRRFYMAHIIPKTEGAHIKPMQFVHNFMQDGKPEFTGATEKGQCDAIREYVSRGIEPDAYWMDAGWYPCDFEWPRTGTWHHNEEHFPNGLGAVGKLCEENGMRFLLWFEPERLKPGSEIDRLHPEWVLKRKTEDIHADRLFNLGDKAACLWLTDMIDGLIKEYHVAVYRQDFNFPPLPIWCDNEEDDRIGALENLHIQGYYAYWDALLLRNPGLFIDSCASGGRRNDIETMRRAVPLQYTDVGLGEHTLKQKQHRLMFEWIPYFRAHSMSWDHNESVDSFSYHLAMAPAITNMLHYQDREELYALSRKMIPIWREAAEIMLEGDYYPLTECRRLSEDYYAMQFAYPCKTRGFFQVVRNPKCEEDAFVAKLTVDEGCDYLLENRETGEALTVSGKTLAAGFEVNIPKRSGALWFYRAV